MEGNKHTPEEFITLKESVILQGVAVSLMVWHHLFGFPERISIPHVLVLDSLLRIETLLAYFGRICIAIFAFCSGYGMKKKAIQADASGVKCLLGNYRSVIKHLLKFFVRYWLVVVVFVPLGFILNVYPVQLEAILKTLLGQSYVYNAEWWYIGHYLKLMLIFPVISVAADWLEKKSPMLLHVGLLAGIVAVEISPNNSFYAVLLYFVEGMYIAHTAWYTKIAKRLCTNRMQLTAAGMLGAVVFVLRTLGVADYYLVAPLVFGLVLLFKNSMVSRYAGKVFTVIGKYSTYVWLTHTFFAYYYFQAFTYVPKYSWLIEIWCIVICIAVGVVLEKVRTILVVRTPK